VKTGVPHWTYDMLAAAWGSPLIVDDKVYVGDEDGDVAIFRHSADPKVAMEDDMPALGEINMGNSVYSTPIVADNVLYIANRTHLFAIEEGATPQVPPTKEGAPAKEEKKQDAKQAES
jgi:outer membrane protein assembly factor BamB